MKIEHVAGTHIRDACADAVKRATKSREVIEFEFNGQLMSITPGMSLEDAYKQWEQKTGSPILTPDEERRKNQETLDKMRRDHAKAISKAGVLTEEQLREADSPWPKTEDELLAYVRTLVDRPHDYGTCCYAMSLAAIAAFNYVAHCVGATGFQAGMAQIDFIRRERSHKFGTVILDLGNILYPQCCDDHHFPHWDELMDREAGFAEQIAAEAKRKISADASNAHPHVVAHWRYIVKRWGSKTKGAHDATVV